LQGILPIPPGIGNRAHVSWAVAALKPGSPYHSGTAPQPSRIAALPRLRTTG
jgi:hypothetical protein